MDAQLKYMLGALTVVTEIGMPHFAWKSTTQKDLPNKKNL
jgi:hypothetical protein